MTSLTFLPESEASPPVSRVAARSESTKQLILDTAETLFSEHGFDGTSLRMITTGAGVNIASVNYHFGSKENLIIELITSRLRPANEARIAALDHAATTGKILEVEEVMEAYMRPLVEMAALKSVHGSLRLLSRLLLEPGPVYHQLISREFSPLVVRFAEAVEQSLPGFSKNEALWAISFASGSLLHVLNQSRQTTCILEDPNWVENCEQLIRRLVDFTSGGIRLMAKSPILPR